LVGAVAEVAGAAAGRATNGISLGSIGVAGRGVASPLTAVSTVGRGSLDASTNVAAALVVAKALVLAGTLGPAVLDGCAGSTGGVGASESVAGPAVLAGALPALTLTTPDGASGGAVAVKRCVTWTAAVGGLLACSGVIGAATRCADAAVTAGGAVGAEVPAARIGAVEAIGAVVAGLAVEARAVEARAVEAGAVEAGPAAAGGVWAVMRLTSLALAAWGVGAPTSLAALIAAAAGAGVDAGATAAAAGWAVVAPVSLEISATSSCSAELASVVVESASTSVSVGLAVAPLLGGTTEPALAAGGVATTGSLKPIAPPDAATAEVDGAGVAATAVMGAGGPMTAIRAANASLKPSPLRAALGALAGSLGSAGLAVVTWAEAASMAPMKRVVGEKQAPAAPGHSAPSSNPRATGEFAVQLSEK
jgi:hypothetical protein